jgi:hypothetical protein
MHITMGRVMALLVLTALLSTVLAKEKSLYFLNKPESIASKQKLAQLSVKAGERTRVFLHYLNTSKYTMQFSLKTSQKTVGVIGFKYSPSPSVAGSSAALDFFNNLNNPKEIAIQHSWRPGQTISGIIEFNSTKDITIECKTGEIVNPKTNVTKTNEIESIYTVDLKDKSEKLRFGGLGDGVNKGQYGLAHKVNLSNKSSQHKSVIIYASPRAGNAILTWGVDGKFTNTPVIQAKSKYRLAAFKLAPGESMQFVTMPVGGMSYPVELEFEPRAIGISEKPTASLL